MNEDEKSSSTTQKKDTDINLRAASQYLNACFFVLTDKNNVLMQTGNEEKYRSTMFYNI